MMPRKWFCNSRRNPSTAWRAGRRLGSDRLRRRVHDPLSLHDLVGDEIAQRRETGHDVASVAQRYAATGPADTAALEGLFAELSELTPPVDWPYDEPSDLPGIIATLPAPATPDDATASARGCRHAAGPDPGRLARTDRRVQSRQAGRVGRPLDDRPHPRLPRARRRLAAARLLPGPRPDAARLRPPRELAADDARSRRRVGAR